MNLFAGREETLLKSALRERLLLSRFISLEKVVGVHDPRHLGEVIALIGGDAERAVSFQRGC